MIFMHLPRCHH